MVKVEEVLLNVRVEVGNGKEDVRKKELGEAKLVQLLIG
jgi:hypothetical protein